MVAFIVDELVNGMQS